MLIASPDNEACRQLALTLHASSPCVRTFALEALIAVCCFSPSGYRYGEQWTLVVWSYVLSMNRAAIDAFNHLQAAALETTRFATLVNSLVMVEDVEYKVSLFFSCV